MTVTEKITDIQSDAGRAGIARSIQETLSKITNEPVTVEIIKSPHDFPKMALKTHIKITGDSSGYFFTTYGHDMAKYFYRKIFEEEPDLVSDPNTLIHTGWEVTNMLSGAVIAWVHANGNLDLDLSPVRSLSGHSPGLGVALEVATLVRVGGQTMATAFVLAGK